MAEERTEVVAVPDAKDELEETTPEAEDIDVVTLEVELPVFAEEEAEDEEGVMRGDEAFF